MIPRQAVVYGGLIESQRLWREGGAGQDSGFDPTPLNRLRPDTIALESASFGSRLLAAEFPIFSFDEGEGASSVYCAHWYQIARPLLPIEARHNRHNVAVEIYDPASGNPLGD